jgi:hypothetical protein
VDDLFGCFLVCLGFGVLVAVYIVVSILVFHQNP